MWWRWRRKAQRDPNGQNDQKDQTDRGDDPAVRPARAPGFSYDWEPGEEAEPATAEAEAAVLYTRSVELSQHWDRRDEAERVSADAVAAYRRLQRPGNDPSAVTARRGLARALWRRSLIVASRSMTDAMTPGRESVALFREMFDAAAREDPASDELVGELGTAMNDLSQYAAGAGLRHECMALMRNVVNLCEGRPGPLARQAWGTALHNQAHAEVNRVLAGGRRPLAPEDLSAAIELANRAVEARREHADPDRAVSRWELANSLLQRGRLFCWVQMGEQGVSDLLEAWKIVSELGGAGADGLKREVEAAMVGAEGQFPEAVAAVDWPKLSPSSAVHWLAESGLLMERRQWKEAQEVVSRAAESGSREAMHMLALLHNQNGNSREADRWFRKAAEAGNADSMVEMARRAFQAKRIPEMERWLSAAAALGNTSALYNYGAILMERGRLDDALPLWERAANQGEALSAQNLGSVSFQRGNKTDAERWWRRGAELGNRQSMINLSALLDAQGKTDEAKLWRRRAEEAAKRS
jgi:tetratricopeptide (TPR) repeat protein